MVVGGLLVLGRWIEWLTSHARRQDGSADWQNSSGTKDHLFEEVLLFRMRRYSLSLMPEN